MSETANAFGSRKTIGPIHSTTWVTALKGRIWLGQNRDMQSRVTSDLHDAMTGGHSGYPVTLARIKQHFAWPGMRHTVKEFVPTCAVCQQAKPDRSRYPGLLQPIPIRSRPWEVATIDFIDGLPQSARFNFCIMVVVDKLAKYSHFVPLVHLFIAQVVAWQFMDHVYKHQVCLGTLSWIRILSSLVASGSTSSS